MIGGAPRRPVVKPNPGVLPRNASHAQAGLARSALLSSCGMKVLSEILRKKAESGDGTAAYRAARLVISCLFGAERLGYETLDAMHSPANQPLLLVSRLCRASSRHSAKDNDYV